MLVEFSYICIEICGNIIMIRGKESFYTIAEIADSLNISQKSVRKYIASKQLYAIKSRWSLSYSYGFFAAFSK